MVEASSGDLSCKIEGENLKDLDTFSKSDPICLVEEKVNGIWQARGQTERIMNDLNPVFQNAVEFRYTSDAQEMKFTMWDHDGGNDFELIGSAEITVQELKLNIADSLNNEEVQTVSKPETIE